MTTETTPLAWTGERFTPEVHGVIELEHVHRYLLARELVKGKRVLDIACGEGYGSALLASVAREVTGVDVAPECIAHASKR
ncbi:MAG TPA: methyltransferase domain-containing protein, partial [Polyangiaceae bacterium]